MAGEQTVHADLIGSDRARQARAADPFAPAHAVEGRSASSPATAASRSAERAERAKSQERWQDPPPRLRRSERCAAESSEAG